MNDAENIQTDNVQVQEELQTAPVVDDAGTATASESEHEEKQESGFNQDAVNKRISKITAEKYQFKTEAQMAKERADKLEAELAAIKAERSIPVPSDLIAPSPDLYYEDKSEYNRQMAEYQAKLAQSVVQQQSKAAQEAERQRREQEDQLSAQRSAYESVLKSAQEAGIDFEELENSAAVLQKRGINQQLSSLIASHERSAPILDYLAKNPTEFHELNETRDVLRVVRKLDELQAKASKRKISNAPEPQSIPKGRGAIEQDDFKKACPGAKFI